MYFGSSQNVLDFGGDRDWHPDPGQDFRIFSPLRDRANMFVNTITEKLQSDLPEIFWEA